MEREANEAQELCLSYTASLVEAKEVRHGLDKRVGELQFKKEVFLMKNAPPQRDKDKDKDKAKDLYVELSESHLRLKEDMRSREEQKMKLAGKLAVANDKLTSLSPQCAAAKRL